MKIDTYHVRYPICGIYIFQSLQLQFLPFQHLIWLLKIVSVLACLIIFGKVDQSLFPRKDIFSIPYVAVCTFGSCVSLLCLRSYLVLRSAKISFMKGGLKPDLVLYISVKSNRRFFTWIHACSCRYHICGFL